MNFKNFISQEGIKGTKMYLSTNYQSPDFFLILLLRDKYKEGVKSIRFIEYDEHFNTCTIIEKDNKKEVLVIENTLLRRRLNGAIVPKKSYILTKKVIFGKKYNVKHFIKKYWKKVVKKGD